MSERSGALMPVYLVAFCSMRRVRNERSE